MDKLEILRWVGIVGGIVAIILLMNLLSRNMSKEEMRHSTETGATWGLIMLSK